MSPVSQYQSILDDAEDFFAPVGRQKKAKVNLDELKQLWDERKEEQIAAQKVGEALIQKELGVSYKELLKKQQKNQQKISVKKFEEGENSKSVGNQLLNEQQEDDNSFHEKVFMEVVVPRVASDAGEQNESVVRNLMKGVFLLRCNIQRKCSKYLSEMLMDLSIQIRHGQDTVSDKALELYELLLSNKSTSGYLVQDIEYVHEYIPDASDFLEMFEKLGQYDGSCEKGEEGTIIIQQVKNYLQIVRMVSQRRKKCNLENQQTDQFLNLLQKILMLCLDKKFSLLQQEIFDTVKQLIQWLDDDQWENNINSFSQKFLEDLPNLSAVIQIAEKIPIINLENFHDRGQELKSQICYLAFLKFYPIQQDVQKVLKKPGKRTFDEIQETKNDQISYLQQILNIFQQQISPKQLLDNFILNSQKSNNSKNSKKNSTNFVLLQNCLILLDFISSSFVRDFCWKKKSGKQINEESLQILWNMIGYLKGLYSALQRRKGNDVERLQALDIARTLELHTKWGIEQYD